MKCSWWLSAVCFLLAACAATGTGFDTRRDDISRVPEAKARVVFLRTDESLLYSARKARVLIDGEKTGGCALGGFIFRDIPPGEHRLVADMWDAPGRCEVIVTAEAGRVYYFQVDPRPRSFWGFAGPAAASDLLGQSMAFSIASGIGGMTAESYGKECGGVFRLYPVDEPTAMNRLAKLRLSE
jgi:hypothetical protein